MAAGGEGREVMHLPLRSGWWAQASSSLRKTGQGSLLRAGSVGLGTSLALQEGLLMSLKKLDWQLEQRR